MVAVLLLMTSPLSSDVFSWWVCINEALSVHHRESPFPSLSSLHDYLKLLGFLSLFMLLKPRWIYRLPVLVLVTSSSPAHTP